MQNRNVHVHYSRGQEDMVFCIGILMNFTTLGKKNTNHLRNLQWSLVLLKRLDKNTCGSLTAS